MQHRPCAVDLHESESGKIEREKEQQEPALVGHPFIRDQSPRDHDSRNKCSQGDIHD